MEVIKRKILLEDNIDRNYNSPTWGGITATTFYLKVILTQTFEDIGLFTDSVYVPSISGVSNPPNYSILSQKLAISGITFPFMMGKKPKFPSVSGTSELILRLTGNTIPTYFSFGNISITGTTDSKLQDVRSYNSSNPYQIGFNISTDVYTNYSGSVVSGVSRVTSITNPITYAFDAKPDANIGTSNQTTGLLYKDYNNRTNTVLINGNSTVVPLTIVSFLGQGWNETNTSLSAITKEEYLFGVVTKPIVQSDVFIDRGATSVMDYHLRLSEIKNLDELIQYGNGFYNITIM